NLSRLAKGIGVHTSFLAHVLSADKNLSFEQATELSELLEHTSLEREFFFALLQIERAGTAKLKKYWQEKRDAILRDREALRSRVGEHHELSAEDRAIYYSSWIYAAVFVSTDIGGGQSLEQIAERFRLSRAKAQEVLTFLLRTGICVTSGNLYQMGKAVVYLSNDSPLVVKHHTNWRIRAMQKMDTRENTELFFTSPMSISTADFARVREVLAKAIEEAQAICRDSKSEEVVNLNIDLFRTIVG
ncbi:MAG: TIGR02147 family protein, partial [Bdellovibrionota bacterium]